MKYLVLLLSLPALYADTLHVSLDTSPLGGNLFSIVFYLINGDATMNNTATVSNAQFGGGSLLGVPTLATTGASGSLATSLTLTDIEFFNAYIHDFGAGSSLSFDLAFTANFAGGTPDSLAFVLLDGATLAPIPTLDPLGSDVLLLFDLSNPGSGQAYATDPERTAITLAAPVVTQSEPASVPEPRPLALTATMLAGLACWRGGARLHSKWRRRM